MKKTIILISALAFATFANAAEIVLKPQGWKEGDSKKLTEELIRSHTDSTTGSTPRVVSTKKTPNKISVQSADSDKYIISIMSLDTGYTKSDSNSIFGAELAKKVRTTPLKFSLSKDGELGHSANYEEFEALFADSQHPFYKTFIIGNNKEDFEQRNLYTWGLIYWYMNKKFETDKELICKKKYNLGVSAPEIDTKMRVSVVNGKVTFESEVKLTEEAYFEEAKKGALLRLENQVESVTLEGSKEISESRKNDLRSIFAQQIDRQLKQIKEQRISIQIKETVVFDEKTGWLISFDKTTTTTSATSNSSTIIQNKFIIE